MLGAAATLGLFSGIFKDVVDEAIILDSHLTGVMSEHAAGLYVGVRPSGVSLKFKQSTPVDTSAIMATGGAARQLLIPSISSRQ